MDEKEREKIMDEKKRRMQERDDECAARMDAWFSDPARSETGIPKKGQLSVKNTLK